MFKQFQNRNYLLWIPIYLSHKNVMRHSLKCSNISKYANINKIPAKWSKFQNKYTEISLNNPDSIFSFWHWPRLKTIKYFLLFSQRYHIKNNQVLINSFFNSFRSKNSPKCFPLINTKWVNFMNSNTSTISISIEMKVSKNNSLKL